MNQNTDFESCRELLERRLSDAIANFEEETGLTILAIEVNHERPAGFFSVERLTYNIIPDGN